MATNMTEVLLVAGLNWGALLGSSAEGVDAADAADRVGVIGE